jgi:hypothetical protein
VQVRAEAARYLVLRLVAKRRGKSSQQTGAAARKCCGRIPLSVIARLDRAIQ